MRELHAILILLFTVFRKVLGLGWYYVAVPFRGYARNVVHNYIFDNKIDCPRLFQRPITETVSGYIISPFHGSNGGYIRYKKVSWLEYQLVFWLLWGWLDDDSNYDTSNDADGTVIFGNTFDLGDKRDDHPYFNFKLATLWNIRNTAYNFYYVQMESSIRHFYYDYKFFRFGWEEDWLGNYYLVFSLWGNK